MGKVTTTFVGDNRPMDKAVAEHKRSLERLAADVKRLEDTRRRNEQRLSELSIKQAEKEFQAKTRLQQRATADFLRELKKIEAEEKRLAQTRKTLADKYASDRKAAFSRFFGGAGSGISSAAGALGIGIGLGGGIALAQQAVDKAQEQARANRLLSASATEAGIAMGILAEKNRVFAASVGISNTAAAETTAQITRLATNAGINTPERIDQLLKSFANLGAARGIQGNDLTSLIGTILSGQDEGLNRLGIADPGQLYKGYAKEIGKTVEELTQMEKVLAAVNAVVEKSAIFDGAAEAQMNSLEGSVQRASAQWDNFTTALSVSFTRSYEFNALIGTLNKSLGDMNKEVESLADKAAKGINIDIEVQAQAKDSATVEFLKHLGIGVLTLAGGLGQGLSPLDRITGSRFGEAGTNLLDQAALLTPGVQQSLQEDFLRQQVNASILSRVTQERSAAEQLANQAVKNAAIQDKLAIEKAQKDQLESYKRLLTSPTSTVAQLEAAKKGIGGLTGLSSDASLDLTQRFDNEILQRLEQQKKKLEEIKKAREDAFTLGLGTSDNPFTSLLSSATQRMRTLVETTKLLPPALREALQLQERGRNATDLLGLRLDTRLDAYSLRNQAAEFRQGFRNDLSDPATVQRILDAQLSILGGRFDAAKDQRLTNIAQGLDPRLLRQDQQYAVAGAFEREATRKLESEKQAVDFYMAMQKLITGEGLKVSVGQGATLQVEVNDSTSTGVSTGTTGNVNARYNRR